MLKLVCFIKFNMSFFSLHFRKANSNRTIKYWFPFLSFSIIHFASLFSDTFSNFFEIKVLSISCTTFVKPSSCIFMFHSRYYLETSYLWPWPNNLEQIIQCTIMLENMTMQLNDYLGFASYIYGVTRWAHKGWVFIFLSSIGRSF